MKRAVAEIVTLTAGALLAAGVRLFSGDLPLMTSADTLSWAVGFLSACAIWRAITFADQESDDALTTPAPSASDGRGRVLVQHYTIPEGTKHISISISGVEDGK